MAEPAPLPDDPFRRLAVSVFRLNGALVAAGDRLVADPGLTSARWQVLGAAATATSPSRLLERPEAAVVNVTTGLVYAPFGATPGYSAAKAGLHAFTRSLRWQTRRSPLQVVDLLPPAVATDLTARYDGPKIGAGPVADALLDALRTGRTEVRPGQTKALYAMSRIAPGFVFRALNRAADRVPLD